MTEPFDIEALLESAAPRTLQVTVCARGDLVDRHAQLVQELDAALSSSPGSLGGNPEVQRLSEAIVAVEEEQAESSLELTVKSVPRKAWADCLAQHPPRKDLDRLDFNTATFPPAAVALCCPAISVDQANRLNEKLPQGEWDKLWNAVIQLNVIGLPRPKLPAATEIARANGNSST